MKKSTKCLIPLTIKTSKIRNSRGEELIAIEKYEYCNFGKMINELRNSRSWTISEFLKRLNEEDIKLSPNYIIKIERHNEIPRFEVIRKMAKVFDCDVELFMDVAKDNELNKKRNK